MSLLPAATEYCFCLGAWDQVVGVTHACDFPPSARTRPQVTRPRVDPHLPSRQLDQVVKEIGRKGESLYELDAELLRHLAPDLLLTQQQCQVCAVTPKDLEDVVKELDQAPRLVSLDGTTYEAVQADARKLGQALDRPHETKQLLLKNWGLAKEIRSRVGSLDRPRVAILDWVDPLMFAGNWIPELAEMAGGDYRLVKPGQPSRWGSWEELEEYEPDLILAAPCGRTLDQTGAELRQALREKDMEDLPAAVNGRLFAGDGDAYFNRPGPRLIYAAGLMARAFHWQEVPALPEAIEAGVRRVS